MKDAIIKNLKRKFNALKEHEGDKDFLFFSLAYTDFICSNEELAPVIKKLIDDGKVPPKMLQQIYNDYMVIPYLRDYKNDRHNHINFPKFYDQDIESRFNLHKNFCELIGNEYKITKNNPELIRVDCDKPIKRNLQNEEYADIQRLHNDLLELLELKNKSVFGDMKNKENKLNLDELSIKNLLRVEKVLRVILDELELQEVNDLIGNKISLKVLEKEGVLFDEVETILNKIDGVRVLNAKLNQIYKEDNIIDPSYTFGITKNDLAQNLFWTGNPNHIKKTKKEVDKKIKEFKEKEDKNQISQKNQEPSKEDIFRAMERRSDKLDKEIKSEKIRLLEEKVVGLEKREKIKKVNEKGEDLIKNGVEEKPEKESFIMQEIKKRVEKSKEKEALKKEIIQELSGQKQNDKKQERIILYLSKDGELWREPKNKYCYPIEKNSDRLKIIKFFVANEIYEYYPTSEMAKHFELTIKNLSNQIGNIRSIARARLKLKFKLLEGVKDSGYRISPKCKITKKDK